MNGPFQVFRDFQSKEVNMIGSGDAFVFESDENTGIGWVAMGVEVEENSFACVKSEVVFLAE